MNAAETWETLFRTQVVMMKRFTKDDVWEGLTMREYDVLFNLSRCSSQSSSLKDLNDALLLSQPSLSRMVERLEFKGLVERHRSGDDGRALIVTLTKEGSLKQKRIGCSHVKAIKHYVDGALTEREQLQLKILSEKLKEAQREIPAFRSS